MNDGTFGIFGLDHATIERLATAVPQPAYLELATRCPVHPTRDGSLFVFGLAEIQKIVRHPDVLGAGASGPSLGSARRLIPLDLDGEEHRKYRRLLDALFAPRQIEGLEAGVRSITNDLVDRFIGAGEVEIYGSFCAILPGTVFLQLLGIPLEDLDYFLSFKNDLLRGDPEESPEQSALRARKATGRFYDYFDKLLEQCDRSDGIAEGMIRRLMSAEVEGSRLSREDVLDICYVLMIAGLDTVAASLSCIFAYLASHPVERRRLVAEPARWPSAVEELLRVETPVCLGVRQAARALELEGIAVPAGTDMVISWAAANLDPETFPDPLTVDLARQPNRHLAFGSGFHRCLGMHLARMELRVALDQFHRRIPEYAIRPGARITYEALPIRFVNPLHLTWSGPQGGTADVG